MNSFVFYGLLLASAIAVTVSGQDKPLCTPDQWEGYEGSIGGYVYHRRPGMIQEYSKVSYDAKNQRKAAFINYRNNDYENKFQMVVRYGDSENEKGRVFVVDLKKDTCWSTTLDFDFKKACIPADTKPHEIYLGLKGKGGLLVSSYRVNKKEVTSVLTVTKEGNSIIPVGETVFGTVMKTSFIQPMGFMDITPGIANATVFDIPQQCKKLSEVSVSEYLMKEHVVFGF